MTHLLENETTDTCVVKRCFYFTYKNLRYTRIWYLYSTRRWKSSKIYRIFLHRVDLSDRKVLIAKIYR